MSDTLGRTVLTALMAEFTGLSAVNTANLEYLILHWEYGRMTLVRNVADSSWSYFVSITGYFVATILAR